MEKAILHDLDRPAALARRQQRGAVRARLVADDDDRIGDRPRNSDNSGIDPTDPARTTRWGLRRSVEQAAGDADRRQLHRPGLALARLPLLERIDAGLARVHRDASPLAGGRLPLAGNGRLDHADGPRETPDPDSGDTRR